LSNQSSAGADFPAKLRCLWKPNRYIVLYGGRGGAKSWGVARALLIQAAEKPLRVLCAREIQNSIAESVHQLLKDQIEALGLSAFFTVTEKEIRGRNGSLFIFAGLRHNVASIKSKEGLDVVWVEEGESVTKNSWDTLIPTIRKEGSRIIVVFNPRLDTDETYKRFVLDPPSDAVVVKIGWQDNKWFPEVLEAERRELQVKDPVAYLNVWEGHCKQVLDGAVYANEIVAATAQNRITRVAYTPGVPVSTFWDIGKRDLTAIWFVQFVGLEPRCIDYLEARGKPLEYYLLELQGRGYLYGEHWLPHDAKHDRLGAQRTVFQQVAAANLGDVREVPNIPVIEGINALRTLFPRMWFDAVKTSPGIERLRRYRFKVDQDTGHYSKEPLHDDNSNGADAARYVAVSLAEPRLKRERKPRRQAGGWMGA
jgi:phage terminase large subunit